MKIKYIDLSPVGQYYMWNGATEDNRTICVFLANNVLHIEIFKDKEDRGESRRITVDCIEQQMKTEEMMRIVNLEIIDKE